MYRPTILAAAAILVSFASVRGFQDRQPEADVRWHTDIEGARKLAKEGGRPLLIVFR